MANSYREYLKMKKYGGEGGDTPSPTLISKTINANGLYLPEDDQADGYNSVSVNVPEVSDIAFVPPQKFKSNGSNLEDYKIFGSDGVVTKTETSVLPLTFTTTEDELRDWEIRGNDDVGENLINVADFTIPANMADERGIKYLLVNLYLDAGTYVICSYQKSTLTSNTRNTLSVILPDTRDYESKSANYHLDSGWHTLTFTLAQASNVSAYMWGHTLSNDCTYTSCMLVKGSTAPDHYIPYQQGVGERTVNLFDYSQGCDWAAGSNGTSNQKITAQQGNVFTVKSTSALYASIRGYDANNARISDSAWSTGGTSTYTAPANIAYVKVIFRNFDYSRVTAEQKATINEVMLVKGSTAPSTYIPYGYEIPISVNGTPQTFYIGNTPLRSGQSISKTSTGVDIATTEGENTISTTLYNKPETSVTYAKSGVGEEVSGSYVIPVKINSTTTNVPIGDTPLMEDEYVDYGEQKIYRRILFMTYNDKHFITKDNKDFCLRRRGYNG